MAILAVSITKSTSFRGVQQEFSNTYHYNYGGVVGAGSGDSAIDAVVAIEKPMHSANVNFIRGRCWTAGGTKAENNMISTKALSGAGTGGAGASNLDKERAYLVRFRAGNDSRGNPVYLRKWWHLDLIVIAGNTVSTAALQNTGTLDSAMRTQLESYGNNLKTITISGLPGTLVSEKGRGIDGATQAHQYLEHHQLGDMWRG